MLSVLFLNPPGAGRLCRLTLLARLTRLPLESGTLLLLLLRLLL